MTAKQRFRDMMHQRRSFQRGSMEYAWRTRAARKYVWQLRGVPVAQWPVER